MRRSRRSIPVSLRGEKSFYSELWLLDEGRASVQNIHTEKMADDLNQPDAFFIVGRARGRSLKNGYSYRVLSNNSERDLGALIF